MSKEETEEIKPDVALKIKNLSVEYYDRIRKYAEEIYEINISSLKIRITKHQDGKHDIIITNIPKLTVEVTSYQFPEII
jgi:hypothetical protein